MSQIRCKNESIATSRAFQSEWNCYIPPVGKGREVAIRKCTYNITNLQKCSFIAFSNNYWIRRNFEKAIHFTFQNIHLYAASKGSARWFIGKFCQSVNPTLNIYIGKCFPSKFMGTKPISIALKTNKIFLNQISRFKINKIVQSQLTVKHFFIKN